MKELRIDDRPPLLIIDQIMLIRMMCTEKCECRTFGDISSKVFP